ncbi:hypothetical protein ILUMI_23874 [Ignelater luminosus]|uniref:Uncharacterized protein n=1 Tax=Ignelater luminosus TaxID=2038154 RepID=A0A8K0C831_IGNLU|nr:hypothetical protein ILUMI_23874 [Ignelater luminosus]
MENADNSKTNIFWGPVTAKEIKKILSHKKPRERIGRRNTISDVEPSRTIYADSPQTDLLIKRHFFGDPSDDVNVSFTSEYFTPNETVHNDKSNVVNSISCKSDNNISEHTKDDVNVAQDCLRDESSLNLESKETLIEKISKVLDMSSCRTSAYSSAGECSNCTSLAPTNTNEIHLNEMYTCGNKSCSSHNQNAVLLILSDDEEDFRDDNVKESCKSVAQLEDNDEVIIISDDENNDYMLFEEQVPIKNETKKSPCLDKIYPVHLDINEMPLLGGPSTSKQLNEQCSGDNSIIHINNQQELTESKLDFSEISQHSTVEEANLSYDDEQCEEYCNIDLTSDTSCNYDEIADLELDSSQIQQYEDRSENRKKNSSYSKSNFSDIPSHEHNYILPILNVNVEQDSPENSYHEEEKHTSDKSSINEQSRPSHNLVNEFHKLDVTEIIEHSLNKLPNQNEDLFSISKHFENEGADYKTVRSCDNSFVSQSIASSSPAQERVYDNYSKNSVINTSLNQDEETNDMHAISLTSVDSKHEWNDTIEEMKRFFTVDDDQLSDENNSDTNDQELNNPNTNEGKLYLDSITSKPKKSLIPVKNANQPLNPHKNVYSKKQNTNLKIPTKIASIKPNYKTIQSPVSVYIKNTPEAPLRQRVPSKPLSTTSLFPKAASSKVANKENESDLPTVIYKPAKHKVVSEREEFKLPGNIQKHISHIPFIIKHQERIEGRKLNQSVIENKLLDGNLTICDSSRLSTSSIEEDVSLLVSKKAYIK